MKFFVVPIMALLAVPAVDAATVKQPLQATVVAPGAQGKASFALGGNASRGRRGKLKVVVRHLSPGKSFGISVAGVRIGTLTTNGSGSGAASFSNPQKGRSQFLGVDPQGHLVEVSDDQGEDVLEGDMPEDNDQGDIQCCLAGDDGEAECDETTEADCAAHNGANMGAGSCFPNPCPTTPPSGDIVCCVPNAGQEDCNEESAADCADEDGVNLGAVACEPDPCAPMPGVVRCCVPENDDAQGNENPQGDAGECEQLTATDCSAAGGTPIGPGSCDPNPCPVTSPSGAFLE